MNQRITYLLIAAFFVFQSCRSDELIEDVVSEIEITDWSESTHSSNVDPNYSVVFKQNEVLRFDIKIDSDDWNDMQNDLANNIGSSSGPGNRPGQGGGVPEMSSSDPIWVPCSFYFEGTEWYKAGIRYKGNSSLNSSYQMGIGKLSFKLDFDQYEDEYPAIENQRFYGFKQLNLKNNYDDRSMMREKVASDLFMDFGLASPQTAFCVVYVDYGLGAEYFGVYTLVEEVDDTVLESQFGDESGNLYKPDGTAASFASGSFNESQMEKKNNEELGDYADVLALYNTINSADRTSNTEQWKTDLNTILDVDVFLKWLAANVAMQNWDTYGVMTHNYYLYNNPANGKLCWIPWDNNEALQEGKQRGLLSLSLDEVNSSWPLIRYIIDVPEYEQKYRQYLREFRDEVFVPASMNDVYSNYYDLLKEYVYDEQPGYTFLANDTNFDSAVEQLKSHVQNRFDEVSAYLE